MIGCCGLLCVVVGSLIDICLLSFVVLELIVRCVLFCVLCARC